MVRCRFIAVRSLNHYLFEKVLSCLRGAIGSLYRSPNARSGIRRKLRPGHGEELRSGPGKLSAGGKRQATATRKPSGGHGTDGVKHHCSQSQATNTYAPVKPHARQAESANGLQIPTSHTIRDTKTVRAPRGRPPPQGTGGDHPSAARKAPPGSRRSPCRRQGSSGAQHLLPEGRGTGQAYRSPNVAGQTSGGMRGGAFPFSFPHLLLCQRIHLLSRAPARPAYVRRHTRPDKKAPGTATAKPWRRRRVGVMQFKASARADRYSSRGNDLWMAAARSPKDAQAPVSDRHIPFRLLQKFLPFKERQALVREPGPHPSGFVGRADI